MININNINLSVFSGLREKRFLLAQKVTSDPQDKDLSNVFASCFVHTFLRRIRVCSKKYGTQKSSEIPGFFRQSHSSADPIRLFKKKWISCRGGSWRGGGHPGRPGAFFHVFWEHVESNGYNIMLFLVKSNCLVSDYTKLSLGLEQIKPLLWSWGANQTTSVEFSSPIPSVTDRCPAWESEWKLDSYWDYTELLR